MAMNLDAVLKIAAKVEGGSALEKLGMSLAGIGDKAGKAISPLGQMNGALRGIADVAATIGLAAVGRDLLNAGIEAQAADVRINALAKSFGEVQGVADVAARAAEQFALGNVEAKNAVTNLYGRLRPMGVSLKDVETVFFGVNKAAKQVGLSTYDTSEVLLQLSQALGSGKLQGDELRSIMERMPAVGQAVAKVMGVSASEIKKLGSEGKITTEVMIRAAAELNKIQPPPPTPMQEFEKAIKDLRTEIGENLLPILTPFVQGLTSLVKAFAALPEPVQTAAILLGALAIVARPIASVITGIGQALILIGPVLTQAGVLFAGFQTVVIVAFKGILTWIGGTFIPGLLAFFSGPVGWTVLAIAAVVAMAIAFREPIANFLKWLAERVADGIDAVVKFINKEFVQPWVDLWNNVLKEPVGQFWTWLTSQAQSAWDGLVKIWGTVSAWWNEYVTAPISKLWNGLIDGIKSTMKGVQDFVVGVWKSIVASVRNAFNGLMKGLQNMLNAAIGIVNRLIAAFNKITRGVAPIPMIEQLKLPQFAMGGVVNRATLAVVGEGGQREYIIPESKMGSASARYLAGARGDAVLGAGGAAGGGGSRGGTPQIRITTGPVLQQDGTRYVTVADLEAALRQASKQMYSQLKSPAGRAALGA